MPTAIFRSPLSIDTLSGGSGQVHALSLELHTKYYYNLRPRTRHSGCRNPKKKRVGFGFAFADSCPCSRLRKRELLLPSYAPTTDFSALTLTLSLQIPKGRGIGPTEAAHTNRRIPPEPPLSKLSKLSNVAAQVQPNIITPSVLSGHSPIPRHSTASTSQQHHPIAIAQLVTSGRGEHHHRYLPSRRCKYPSFPTFLSFSWPIPSAAVTGFPSKARSKEPHQLRKIALTGKLSSIFPLAYHSIR